MGISDYNLKNFGMNVSSLSTKKAMTEAMVNAIIKKYGISEEEAEELREKSFNELIQEFPNIDATDTLKESGIDIESIFPEDTLDSEQSTDSVSEEEAMQALDEAFEEYNKNYDIDAISGAQETYTPEEKQYIQDTMLKDGQIRLKREDLPKYNSVKNLLEDVYKDADVLAIIAGSDGELSAEEMEKFENYIKHINGDKDKLELEDLKKAVEDIKDFKFDIDDYNNYDPETDELDKAKKANGASGAGGAGGASGAGGPGGVSDPGDSGDTKPKDYSDMSIDELNAEKDKEAKNLEGQEAKRDEEQQKLSDIDNGNNEELQALDEKADEAEQAWEDVAKEIDEGLAEALDKANEDVDKAQTEVDQADSAVFNQEQKVSEAQAQKDYAQSYKEQKTAERQTAETNKSTAETNLSTAQANLEAAQGETDEEGNPVDTSALEAAVNACQAQLEIAQARLEAAKEMETQAEEQLQSAETLLEAEKATKTELEEKLSEKQGALVVAQNAQEQAQQDLIAKIPEDDETGLKEKLEAAKDAYTTAKSDYSNKKQELRTEQKTAIGNAQKDINTTKTNIQKIDNEIGKRKVDEKTNKDIKDIKEKFGLNPDYFSKDLKLGTEWVKGHGDVMPYLLIGPQPPEEGVEYPWLVILHGSDETGYSESCMRGQSYVKAMINGEYTEISKSDLAKFNGYVIIPESPHACAKFGGSDWSQDCKLKQIYNVIEDVAKTHNLDKSKGAIAGHSVGGAGALYFAQYFNDSSHNKEGYKLTSCQTWESTQTKVNKSKLDMPVTMYAGDYNVQFAQQTCNNLGNMGDFVYVKGCHHGNCPGYSINKSVDKDGVSNFWRIIEEGYENS